MRQNHQPTVGKDLSLQFIAVGYAVVLCVLQMWMSYSVQFHSRFSYIHTQYRLTLYWSSCLDLTRLVRKD